ncbi:MAG: ABC transporter permease [Coleofasciculus sp. C1-SOL-03]|uniref:ABC transporter permease n=1 Tax=Coleofasciculus sp. C1-SOL-03 TaxID=3069522 RepID=UPI0032F89477
MSRGEFINIWVATIDQINIPLFLFIVPMFTFCGTYFPRETLPPILGTIANLLPLAALVDLLRWSLGLPKFWLVELIGLVLGIAIFSGLAWRQIYPQLFR